MNRGDRKHRLVSREACGDTSILVTLTISTSSTLPFWLREYRVSLRKHAAVRSSLQVGIRKLRCRYRRRLRFAFKAIFSFYPGSTGDQSSWQRLHSLGMSFVGLFSMSQVYVFQISTRRGVGITSETIVRTAGQRSSNLHEKVISTTLSRLHRGPANFSWSMHAVNATAMRNSNDLGKPSFAKSAAMSVTVSEGTTFSASWGPPRNQ